MFFDPQEIYVFYFYYYPDYTQTYIGMHVTNMSMSPQLTESYLRAGKRQRTTNLNFCFCFYLFVYHGTSHILDTTFIYSFQIWFKHLLHSASLLDSGIYHQIEMTKSHGPLEFILVSGEFLLIKHAS